MPIVGYERRFKGQVTGIELKRIEHSEIDNKDSTTYTIKLSHQVFTNNTVAKFVFLPAEILKFTSDKKDEIVQFRVPEWLFRVSPIAVYGSVELKDDISPFRAPFLLNATPEKRRLHVAIVLLCLSLLSLLYILGKRAWLPFMGKPFAKAYRNLAKLPNTPEGIKQAVSDLHQALNVTAGNSLFSDNLQIFIANKPGFKPVQIEIELKPHMAWVKTLSAGLRIFADSVAIASVACTRKPSRRPDHVLYDTMVVMVITSRLATADTQSHA